MKLGVIGGGAMGEAVISSVIRAGAVSPDNITVADAYRPRVEYLQQTYSVNPAANNVAAIDAADFVLLAVKPQDAAAVGAELHGHMQNRVAISIMAGLPIKTLTTMLGTGAVIRAMPNTPAQIGEGMTVWTATPEVADIARQDAAKIFASMGAEAFVAEERYLDMATAVSGSGPAYVFLFMEALTDAGVHIGLGRDLAATMALKTVLGSARYAQEAGGNLAELRNRVTSPAGTTADALRALEHGGFRAAVVDAVIAAHERSKALGREDSK